MSIDLIQNLSIMVLAICSSVQGISIIRLQRRLTDDNLMVIQVSPGTTAVTTKDGFKLAEIKSPNR